MRIKRKTDYSEISRRSVRSDFKPYNRTPEREKGRQAQKQPQINAIRRIAFVNENSGYYKYRNLILGKQVRLLREAPFGGWYCSFVFDEDRRALNRAAEWSEGKDEYLFDGVKFK